MMRGATTVQPTRRCILERIVKLQPAHIHTKSGKQALVVARAHGAAANGKAFRDFILASDAGGCRRFVKLHKLMLDIKREGNPGALSRQLERYAGIHKHWYRAFVV